MKEINITVDEILDIIHDLIALAEHMENDKDKLRLFNHIVIMQTNLIDCLIEEEEEEEEED